MLELLNFDHMTKSTKEFKANNKNCDATAFIVIWKKLSRCNFY